MDPFSTAAAELTGSLISMEFTGAGRIQNLWASDPHLPEEGEERQFVIPPLMFGEEDTNDYLPGTILIGARTGPDQPWMSARNVEIQRALDFDEDEDLVPGVGSVEFDYSFSFLDDIQGKGRFYEEIAGLTQIVWELELRNTGRATWEIGELGFPMAFNTFLDGFGWDDEQLEKLWNSRFHVHKFIGGAASWMHVQRMNGEAPGLLIFPGKDSAWELCHMVPSSMNTQYQWEGIPVLYAHSAALTEREGWQRIYGESTSLILEPGDSRKYEMRFAVIDSDRHDGVGMALAQCGRPSVRLLPSAVVPVGVGAGVEVQGQPMISANLVTMGPDGKAQTAVAELDKDEQGGFVYLRPEKPGPMTLQVETADSLANVHLMAIEPIETLIKKRAQFIAERQVVRDERSPLNYAIVMFDRREGAQVLLPNQYMEPSGIESSVADALFLAEKNTLYPDRGQIQVLDEYCDRFLLARVQNPATAAVASYLGEFSAVGEGFGRPMGYPLVASLHHAMSRVARTFGETRHDRMTYLVRAWRTAMAMFQYGWRHYVRTVGVLGFSQFYGLVEDLRAHDMADEADRLLEQMEAKAEELTAMRSPYAGETAIDTSGLEEVFAAAKHLNDDAHLERTVRAAFAARSLSPTWWWYGSDKRYEGTESTPLEAYLDKGEACLAHTTIPNSLIFFSLLDRDYLGLPDAYMRMAFAGMLGPWALVGPEGEAAMSFCPDPASKQYQFNRFNGSSGIGYFHYLRGASSLVLPSRNEGVFTFGCHLDETPLSWIVTPWDGVGRRIVMRQIGVNMTVSFGVIRKLELFRDKRRFSLTVENPSDKKLQAEVEVSGLWGERIAAGRSTVKAKDGVARLPLSLGPLETVTMIGEVVG